MLQKTIERQARKNRETWVGYYPRKTPTKKTKLERQERKHKNKQALSHTVSGLLFYQYSGRYLWLCMSQLVT